MNILVANKNGLVALFCAVLLVIWSQHALLAVKASPATAGMATQASPTPDDSPATIWEYRILSFSSLQATKRPLGDAQFYFSNQPFLEDEINKLAAQGYVVDRFEIEPPPCIGSEGCFGYSQYAVILKRARK